MMYFIFILHYNALRNIVLLISAALVTTDSYFTCKMFERVVKYDALAWNKIINNTISASLPPTTTVKKLLHYEYFLY